MSCKTFPSKFTTNLLLMLIFQPMKGHVLWGANFDQILKIGQHESHDQPQAANLQTNMIFVLVYVI